MPQPTFTMKQKQFAVKMLGEIIGEGFTAGDALQILESCREAIQQAQELLPVPGAAAMEIVTAMEH